MDPAEKQAFCKEIHSKIKDNYKLFKKDNGNNYVRDEDSSEKLLALIQLALE